MAKGNIGVTTENIFPVIKKFLYSDHEIFLREIVSNAVDATQKLKTLAEKGDFKGEMGDTSVHISLDKEAGTLTISDHGIGMTEEEIERYINQIAFSGAEEFLEKHKDDAATIAQPENRLHDGVVEISAPENGVAASYKKDDAFVQLDHAFYLCRYGYSHAGV